MHELPIVKAVLEAALRHAEEQQAKKIHKVVLSVGQMHDLVPEWADKFFRFASQGTIAAEAVIEIESIPIICRCGQCQENYLLHIHGPEDQMCCPLCRSADARMLSGNELLIKEIEVY